MRTAREVAHAIICERQDSAWCHWTTDRSVHAHYCDTLTAAIEARDAEHEQALAELRHALETIARLYVLNGEASAALSQISKLTQVSR